MLFVSISTQFDKADFVRALGSGWIAPVPNKTAPVIRFTADDIIAPLGPVNSRRMTIALDPNR